MFDWWLKDVDLSFLFRKKVEYNYQPNNKREIVQSYNPGIIYSYKHDTLYGTSITIIEQRAGIVHDI